MQLIGFETEPNGVKGARLILGFEDIFLRPPTLTESDISFSAEELLAWFTILQEEWPT